MSQTWDEWFDEVTAMSPRTLALEDIAAGMLAVNFLAWLLTLTKKGRCCNCGRQVNLAPVYCGCTADDPQDHVWDR